MAIYHVVTEKGLTDIIFNGMVKFTQNLVMWKIGYICICIYTHKERSVWE